MPVFPACFRASNRAWDTASTSSSKVFRTSSLLGRPTKPKVLDAGGSTVEARWFDPADLAELALTEVTEEALRQAGLH